MLGKGATLASGEAINRALSPNPRHIEIALQLFRLWSTHPAVKHNLTSSNASDADPSDQLPRTSIWKAYYKLLTTILQDGLPYIAPSDGPNRPQLANELRRVESICEGSLLRESKFPTATANNFEIEEWVEQVISNWQVLCGPRWQDQDLGEGGQNAVGRNVLDVSMLR